MADKKTVPTTEEEQESNEGSLRVYKARQMEAQAKEARRKYDWEWTIRQLYVRGYHYAKYNRATNTVVFSTRTGVRISINLVTAHLRGVRNQITSFQPKWEVLPKVTTEEAFENARFSGKVLDYIYDKAQIKRKIKEVVNDALTYSVGIWYFDTDADQNIVIRRVDPFDFYVDPNCKSPDINDPEDGAEYVILAHQVPIDMLKKDKRFKHTDELETDNLPAAAEYKRFLIQVIRQNYQNNKEVNPTVILRQLWKRERQDDGEIKIRLVTYVENVDEPLSDELLDTGDYPFEVLQGDINGGEFYGEAWVKHLIPINRVIDALESHIFEYNHLFARGRFVIDKNSGVRTIVNQHGQIIEKNRGSTVTSLPIAPLPPTPESQIDRMKVHLEDISGVHDATLGRMPGSARSGTAIAELKQADATNQADLVDNLEDFLSRSGKRILKLISENWTTTRLVATTGNGGQPEYFMAIGDSGATKKNKFKYGDKELPLAVIGADNEVRVQVGSWLAYTKEARQEKLKEMYRLGAIDQQTFLQHAEFADIDGILQRTREEKILQQFSESKSQQVEKEYGIQMNDETLARGENELMEEGTEQHAFAQDDHEVHLMVHKEADQKNQLVQDHIKEHEDFIKWQSRMQSQPVPPPAPPMMGVPGMPPPPGGEAPPGGGLPPPPGGGNQFPPFMMGPKIGPAAPPVPPPQMSGGGVV